jgi:hypothetical protein
MLVGSWRIPPEVVAYHKTEGVEIPSHELLLREDGTFSVRNIPYLWGIYNEPWISGEGRWEIVRGRALTWYVSLEFSKINIDEGRTAGSLMISGRIPPYTLGVWTSEFRGFPLEKE